ncbi:DUF397 domain-containing protein [Streptosporangium amethystogenes subsp. fukuiense]|uniref:DUF397 domain-containing protein n=1 Tax=Streptosporangium amethystogenes subsp. fukuiense TaxID=698418 RepID=A0ABW2T6P5_9ACTN
MGEEPDLSHAEWHTSSLSGSSGQCVQVALLGRDVAVRDSKNPNGPALVFENAVFAAFLGAVKTGQL